VSRWLARIGPSRFIEGLKVPVGHQVFRSRRQGENESEDEGKKEIGWIPFRIMSSDLFQESINRLTGFPFAARMGPSFSQRSE